MNSEYVGPVMTASLVEYGRIEWAARCVEPTCSHAINEEMCAAGDEATARLYVKNSLHQLELVSRYTAPWQAAA